MKTKLIHLLLWLLAKLGYNAVPTELLPATIEPFHAEIKAMCIEEAGLVHGSTDILGDSWLKLRRVATKIKKAHPGLAKRDIFRAIIIIHEELEENVAS